MSHHLGDSRLSSEVVWGLPRLREHGRLPRGGSTRAECPEVREVLLGVERRNRVSERGHGGQQLSETEGLGGRPGGQQDTSQRPRMAAGGLDFTLKSHRMAKKECRVQGETELT